MERVGPDVLPGLNPFMGTGNDVVQHAAATVTGSAERKFQVPIPGLDALDYAIRSTPESVAGAGGRQTTVRLS